MNKGLKIVVMLGVVLLVISPLTAKQADSGQKGYIGIRIDPNPLPGILHKHLQLADDQGLRIENVMVDSPADKAGLERDDIIVQLGDDDVTDYEAFVADVQKSGAGNEVSLGIIHLGEKKTVKLELADLSQSDENAEWKYPSEPQMMSMWQPGKMYRMRPGEENWMEVPWRDIPTIPDLDIHPFFNEIYKFNQKHDGANFDITIKGNPADDDTWITVRKDDVEYKVKVGDIGELPREYREPVEQALEKAKDASAKKRSELTLPRPRMTPPQQREDLFKVLPRQDRKQEETLKDVQEQMKRLKEQLDKIQKEHEQLLRDLKENKGTSEQIEHVS